MPVLWVCVVIMGGFGVWWLFADLLPGTGQPVAEVEQGSFEVPGGREATLTNLERRPPRPRSSSRSVHDRLRPRLTRRRSRRRSAAGVQARDEVRARVDLVHPPRRARRPPACVVTDEVIVNGDQEGRAGDDAARVPAQGVRGAPRGHAATSSRDPPVPQCAWTRPSPRRPGTSSTSGSRRPTRTSARRFVLFDTPNTEIPLDADREQGRSREAREVV